MNKKIRIVEGDEVKEITATPLRKKKKLTAKELAEVNNLILQKERENK